MRALSLASVMAVCLSATAHGAILTFETVPVGSLNAPGSEDGFTFAPFSGGLFVSPFGNPGHNVEADGFESGVLRIVAASGTSSPFLFSSLDYGSFSYSFDPVVQTLVVTGLLGGAVVGTDSYTEQNTVSGFYTNETPSNLAGIAVDELRISLNGGYAGGGVYYQTVDNIVLTATAVPEPTTLSLVGFGAAGIAAARRYRGS